MPSGNQHDLIDPGLLVEFFKSRGNFSDGSVEGAVSPFVEELLLRVRGGESFDVVRMEDGEALLLEHAQHAHGRGCRLAPRLGRIVIGDRSYADKAVRLVQESGRAEVLAVDPHGIQDVGAAEL